MSIKHESKVSFDELADAEILAAIRYLDPDGGEACQHGCANIAIWVTLLVISLGWLRLFLLYLQAY